VSKVAHF